PIEPLEDGERGSLSVIGSSTERSHREQPDPWGGPQHCAMRGDRAGHGGAMGMRPFLVGGGVETGDDGSGNVGMRCIGPRIDDRDQHFVAVCQPMGLDKLELVRSILGSVYGLPLILLILLILREFIEVVWLCACDCLIARVGADIPNHISNGGVVIDSPAVQR